MDNHEELKGQVETRALEVIRQVTTSVANLFEFTCGVGDWSLINDGVNFFLVSQNDDALEVRIKVEVEIVE